MCTCICSRTRSACTNCSIASAQFCNKLVHTHTGQTCVHYHKNSTGGAMCPNAATPCNGGVTILPSRLPTLPKPPPAAGDKMTLAGTFSFFCFLLVFLPGTFRFGTLWNFRAGQTSMFLGIGLGAVQSARHTTLVARGSKASAFIGNAVARSRTRDLAASLQYCGVRA